MPLVDAFNFSGKSVLVCGASDGIGYGIARAFVEAGAIVTATGTRHKGDYDHDFSGMRYACLNIEQQASIDSLAAQFETLDVLVNCVGTVFYKKAEFERESFERVIAINLTGAMSLSTAFLPLLESTKGNIVHLDSCAAIKPALNNPAYTASKAGLKMLAKGLAQKWGPKGVRVNTVAPGFVPTKLTASQTGPEMQATFAKSNPIGRFGTPDDIAAGVLYLASPLASYVTGHQLVIDGGLTLG